MTTGIRRWTQARAWEWYRRQPQPFGCNFLPSTAVNATEMWQEQSFDEETIRRELSWAARYGMNSCRVFLPYLVWQKDPERFKDRFATFLRIAAQHALSAMPILFDDCAFAGKEPYPGRQDAPIPGVHNSGWTPSPGPTIADDRTLWPQLEAYVRDVIGTFGQDPRVLIWDLYNEPGNNERGAKSLPLLEQTFLWARAANPSQPLTAGIWGCKETDMQCLHASDIVTFHHYAPADQLRARIVALQRYGYPLLCTEWMARTLGSRFSTHLPIFLETEVGSYMWGLVSGKTQTSFPWGSPAGAQEPELWFHDLLRPDGTPYDQEEIATIEQFCRALHERKGAS